MIYLYTGTRHQGIESAAAACHVAANRPRFVIVGDARGVDAAVRAACLDAGIPFLVAPALWDAEGKSAGPKRNNFMIWILRTLLGGSTETAEVHAFPDSESVGTWTTVSMARAADLVVEVHENE